MNEDAKQIAKQSKSSFYYSFSLLSPEKRDAMNTVYAFCRQTDDIVDTNDIPEDTKFEKLVKWRNEVELALKGNSEYVLLNRLIEIAQKFNIPFDPIFDLIDGMKMDIENKRYLNFDDLMNYCYKVASTVGLMCIEIFGYNNKSTKDYAINLGYALQLTNILRDVGEDADNGRIYLPMQDLSTHKISEYDIFTKKFSSNFKELMRQEAQKAKDLYTKANTFLDIDDKKSMFAARAMQHIYFKLLEKIEENNYNIFDKRISVPTYQKAYLSLGVFLKYTLVY